MMADMALTGRDNYYIGDGTARFDLVHVDSVALGHICAAEHLEPVNNQV
jgi:nucleoside-diphosphate-sugar epimerase